MDFGITEYTNSAPGVFGVLKHRFKDFIVRECCPEGKVSFLKSLDGSLLESGLFKERELPTLDESAVTNFLGELGSLCTQEKVDMSDELCATLKDFLMRCVSKDVDMPFEVKAMAVESKEARKAIHGLVKKYLSAGVDSSSSLIDGQNVMALGAIHMHKGNKAGGAGVKKRDKRGENVWPKGLGDFLQFTLMKSNIDTIKASQAIAKTIRCKDNSITYAGVKDKRGVTAQRVTVYRRKPSELVAVNRKGAQYGGFLRVGDFSYVKEPLRAGQLTGNRFTIILRDVTESAVDIESACNSLKKSGFLNYFGLQRFGRGGQVDSSRLGLEYIKNNLANVTALSLGLDLNTEAASKSEVSRLFSDEDLNEAMANFPPTYRTELGIIESLRKFPNDARRALNGVPRTTRSLCAHAYQSSLFNKALSERITLYGVDGVVEGDIVSVHPPECVPCDVVDSDQGQGHEKEDGGKRTFHVRHVTKEDVECGTYTMEDVVLPLPGYDSLLPLNKVGDVYEEALAADGISLAFFKDGASKDCRMSGTYRHILQVPIDFEWQLIKYAHPDEDLVTTELDAHQEHSKIMQDEARVKRDARNTVNAQRKESQDEGQVTAAQPVCGPVLTPSFESGTPTTADVEAANRSAIRLDFTLRAGVYATMLIRELSKGRTSPEFFRALNDAAAAKGEVESFDPEPKRQRVE